MEHLRGFENVVTCPYNKAHQILAHKLQTHLIKCAKQYPDLKLEVCPFDVTHRIKASEMKAHKLQCPGRKNFDSYVNATGPEMKKQEVEVKLPVRVLANQEGEESWDDIWTPSYNPQKAIADRDVLRNTIGMTPSERKAFREKEHRRLRALENGNDF